MTNRIPYRFEINTKIVVDELIPHAVNVRPRDKGVFAPKLFGTIVGSLTNNAELSNYRILSHFLTEEFFLRDGRCVSLDPLNCISDVT